MKYQCQQSLKCSLPPQKSTRRSDSGSVENVGIYQDFDKKPRGPGGDTGGEKSNSIFLQPFTHQTAQTASFSYSFLPSVRWFFEQALLKNVHITFTWPCKVLNNFLTKSSMFSVHKQTHFSAKHVCVHSLLAMVAVGDSSLLWHLSPSCNQNVTYIVNHRCLFSAC